MEDIGSQETVISSGAGGPAADNANAVAAAAALGITADGLVCGNPAGLQQQLSSTSVSQEMDDDQNDDDDDEDDDDVETFNLDDVIEAVAAGTLG